MTNRPALEFVERNVKVWKWFIWLAWLLGFLATCCSGVTLCGYWAGVVEWQMWAGGTPMALNTAACIEALGIAVMILAQTAANHEHRWVRGLKRSISSVVSP